MNLWLKELKNIAYEMEDVMDEYTYELLRDQVEYQNKGASTTPSRKRKSMEDEEKMIACLQCPCNTGVQGMDLTTNSFAVTKNIHPDSCNTIDASNAGIRIPTWKQQKLFLRKVLMLYNTIFHPCK
ncbi:hypothetical protein J5N97_014542 [Dioscorea zingiberensis]|uniref:Disease resistance N-terminal domain-containing protein n=1 Tax=Dioscorea zingiberensis TaxID=325984 RepID=A0A9D5HJV7_9LILI|nr:hypothetical protein J5N97_014542 [Dioscorea zingiberensis]